MWCRRYHVNSLKDNENANSVQSKLKQYKQQRLPQSLTASIVIIKKNLSQI